MEKLPSTYKILLYKNLLKKSKTITIFDPLFYDFAIIQIKSSFRFNHNFIDKNSLKKELKKCNNFLKFLSEFEEFVKGNKCLSEENKNVLLNLLDLTYGQKGMRRFIFLTAYSTYANNEYISEKKENMRFNYYKNKKVVLPNYFQEIIQKKLLSNDLVMKNQFLSEYYNNLL